MNALLRSILPVIVLAPLFTGSPALADQPGAHPAYLHALADLRNARANLERRGGDPMTRWDEGQAIGNVNAAIVDIKQASIDDGKDLDDHPPVDAREPRFGRLHKALAALYAAHADVAREEDNGFARDLKHRALRDIDAAILRTREGLCDAGDPYFCR